MYGNMSESRTPQSLRSDIHSGYSSMSARRVHSGVLPFDASIPTLVPAISGGINGSSIGSPSRRRWRIIVNGSTDLLIRWCIFWSGCTAFAMVVCGVH